MELEIRGGDVDHRHIGDPIRWQARDGRSGRGVLERVVITSVAKYLTFADGQTVVWILPRRSILGREKDWKHNPRLWTLLS